MKTSPRIHQSDMWGGKSSPIHESRYALGFSGLSHLQNVVPVLYEDLSLIMKIKYNIDLDSMTQLSNCFKIQVVDTFLKIKI